MLRIFSYPLIAATLAVGITEVIPIVKWLIAHPEKYQFVGMGMAGYFIVTFIGIFKKNEKYGYYILYNTKIITIRLQTIKNV